MKLHNTRAILSEVRGHGLTSRADLAVRLKMSKTTVSTLVAELIEKKLIHEIGTIQSNVGRRAVSLQFNDSAGFVLGIDIGKYWIRFGLANLSGKIFCQTGQPRLTSGNLAMTLHEIESGAHDIMSTAQIPSDKVLSVCVSAPGIVEPDGSLRMVSAIPELERVSLNQHVQSWFPAAVVLTENDINVATSAENWQGRGTQYETFAYMGIGSGVGCGLILRSELFRGAHGAAGEIGSLVMGVGEETELEHEISSSGILREAEKYRGSAENTFPDVKAVFDAIVQKPECFVPLTEWLADRLAYAIKILNSVLNPEAIILGGGIGRHLEFLLPTVNQRCASSGGTPKLEISQLGDNIQLIGAVGIAMNGIIDSLPELEF